jgi:hypothetical protein
MSSLIISLWIVSLDSRGEGRGFEFSTVVPAIPGVLDGMHQLYAVIGKAKSVSCAAGLFSFLSFRMLRRLLVVFAVVGLALGAFLRSWPSLSARFSQRSLRSTELRLCSVSYA